ncbi:putative TetR family transcriptional regulator [Gordonia rhizosphera NBRC 16068]|uniref:Putative TetR family transcriptional regulator n=1 Tax=Gordonia rhizosphera NBRC 16068 TaxID=1108045 RepID=K6WSV2_9ACTN|nr:putative TetR family transcriptional regulator [Gordonia rhizosphera NBRC 16068]
MDAAEAIMLEKGYAAVTSRKVAESAGLKPQLVHYYFRTMDELFLEMFRRQAQAGLEQQRELLRSPQPLWALWQFSIDPTVAKFTTELLALANHRTALRAEIARYAAQLRVEAQAVIEEKLAEYGVDGDRLPAAVAIVIMTSVSRVVMMEESLGFSNGHQETFDFVEHHLRRLEGEPRQHVAALTVTQP